uniref:Uncharacterized protein n=1 Tax=Pipistrellus kuhlii TaxID=59472 RepID=A0A7J7ZJG8_PIPKU|nr:hypothetical protein mPipKuh1_009622 [Pipistrellus kuhlii]
MWILWSPEYSLHLERSYILVYVGSFNNVTKCTVLSSKESTSLKPVNKRCCTSLRRRQSEEVLWVGLPCQPASTLSSAVPSGQQALLQSSLGKRRISNIHLKPHLNNESVNVGPFPPCIQTAEQTEEEAGPNLAPQPLVLGAASAQLVLAPSQGLCFPFPLLKRWF